MRSLLGFEKYECNRRDSCFPNFAKLYNNCVSIYRTAVRLLLKTEDSNATERGAEVLASL